MTTSDSARLESAPRAPIPAAARIVLVFGEYAALAAGFFVLWRGAVWAAHVAQRTPGDNLLWMPGIPTVQVALLFLLAGMVAVVSVWGLRRGLMAGGVGVLAAAAIGYLGIAVAGHRKASELHLHMGWLQDPARQTQLRLLWTVPALALAGGGIVVLGVAARRAWAARRDRKTGVDGS